MTAFISSPFSATGEHKGTIEYKRYIKALKYQTMLNKSGVSCISPIALFYWHAKKHNLRGDAEFWKEIDLYLLEQCDVMHVLCIPGWKVSAGVLMEIEHAKKKGIEVIEIYGDFYE